MSDRPIAERRAGFVLAGGRSSRMGRDKALLPVGGETMLARTVRLVRDAAGSATLIAPPDRYAGFDAVADKIENCGPLGGLYTALTISAADWNLVVSCDLPNLNAQLLDHLFEIAGRSRADAVVAQTAAGLEPLCAIYHRRSLAAARSCLDRKILKMHDFLSTLLLEPAAADARALANVNTPEEWLAR